MVSRFAQWTLDVHDVELTDVDAEVERLVGLGARRVDIGQTDANPFVVLADPEGNEFCVLRRHQR